MGINTVTAQKIKILDIYNQLLGLLSLEQQQSTKQRIQPCIDQMASGQFQLVVMGEIKKGKSSFISALLGEYDLLPSDSDVATSTVYKIKYGRERKYTVVFNSESHEKQYEEITQEQIPEYGTEKWNQSNEKKVAFIQIELPHPMLEQGLIIVDTPGVGGLFKKHRGITFEYAPSADAVFFVVDSVETVLNAQEIKFLKDLYKITEHVYFVQTKTDSVDTYTWKSWKDRNIDILINSVELQDFGLSKERLKYFTISSKLKKFADDNPDSDEGVEDLEASGFVQLNDFVFNQLICEKNKILTERALSHLTSETQYHERHAADRLENVNEENKKVIADKEQKIEEILRKLNEWRNEGWKDAHSRFSHKLSQQTATCNSKIHEILSPDRQVFRNKIENITTHYDSMPVLVDQSDEIISNHITSCAEIGKNVIVQYLADVEKFFYEISHKALSDFKEITKFNDISISRTSLDMDNKFSYGGVAVDVAAGGVVGGAVAGGMWWALIGAAQVGVIAGPGGGILIGVASAAGPLGWAAIGVVGLLGAVGTSWGCHKIRDNKKLKEAIAQLNNHMTEISLKSIENFASHIDKIEEEIKSGSVDFFEKISTQSRHEIEARLMDLKMAKQLSEEEAAEEKEKRQNFLSSIRELSGILNTMTTQQV